MKIIGATYISLALYTMMMSSCEDHSAHSDSADSSSHQSQHGHGMDDMGNMDIGNSEHGDMLMLTDRERLLAGIQTDTVRLSDFQQSVSALGLVALDDNTVNIIAAKIEGRIEHLYQRNPGAEISTGQPLYDLYSETLITEQQELLQLISNKGEQALIEAARSKLKLHGLTSGQISSVESTGSVPRLSTIYANVGGFISQLNIRVGQYIVTGESLFEIASLDVVRVNVQVYGSEISLFGQSQSFQVTSEAVPDKIFSGFRILDNPSLDMNSKIYQVPLRVDNKDHLLRPGMMTNVQIVTTPEQRLTVPANALLNENGMSMVWVLEADGMFSRRMVQTGKANEHSVEIISGLHDGEKVVTNGVFLLNSEFILRKGANSMAGMEM